MMTDFLVRPIPNPQLPASTSAEAIPHADRFLLPRTVNGYKVGYVPIHVGLVADEIPVVRLPHYREYRPVQEEQ